MNRGTGVDALLVLGVPAVASGVLAVAFAPTAIVGAVTIAAGLAVPAAAAAAVLRRRPRVVTPADRVTLGRVALTGVVSAGVVLVLSGAVPARTWTVAAVVGVALLLDAVDGWVARRTGTASPAGARLDMTSDAAALLVLSVLAAVTVGWWVLAIGLMRYAYVAASWLRPALRSELAYSQFRRVIAGVQDVALLVALLPITPVPLAVVVLAGALILLLASFVRDVVSLERREARVNRDRRG